MGYSPHCFPFCYCPAKETCETKENIKSTLHTRFLKWNKIFKKKTVTGKTPFFVIGSFCIPHSICLSIGFWQSSFVYKCCVFDLSTERSNHSFLSVWWITFFKHIYSLTIECREIDWLCKQHMKKFRSSQASIAINSCTELSIS